MSLNEIALLGIGITDLVTSFLILIYLNRIRMQSNNRIITFGFLVTALGLFAQAFKNFALLLGTQHEMSSVLYWSFKDLGIAIIVIGAVGFFAKLAKEKDLE